jgi:hypothetical protein
MIDRLSEKSCAVSSLKPKTLNRSQTRVRLMQCSGVVNPLIPNRNTSKPMARWRIGYGSKPPNAAKLSRFGLPNLVMSVPKRVAGTLCASTSLDRTRLTVRRSRLRLAQIMATQTSTSRVARLYPFPNGWIKA